MASLMSTLVTRAPSGVKLSMPATGQQMLTATLVELPLDQWQPHPDQWEQHRDQWQQQWVQQQRRLGQEVSPVDPTLQLAAPEHYVDARLPSL